jgi:hypothetical protein
MTESARNGRAADHGGTRGQTGFAVFSDVGNLGDTIKYSGRVQRNALAEGVDDQAERELVASRGDSVWESAIEHVQAAPVESNSPVVPAPVRMLRIPLASTKTFELKFPTDLSKDDFGIVMETIKRWEPLTVTRGLEA